MNARRPRHAAGRQDTSPGSGPDSFSPKASVAEGLNPIRAARQLAKDWGGRGYLVLTAFFALLFVNLAAKSASVGGGLFLIGFGVLWLGGAAITGFNRRAKPRPPVEHLAKRDNAAVLLGWALLLIGFASLVAAAIAG